MALSTDEQQRIIEAERLRLKVQARQRRGRRWMGIFLFLVMGVAGMAAAAHFLDKFTERLGVLDALKGHQESLALPGALSGEAAPAAAETQTPAPTDEWTHVPAIVPGYAEVDRRSADGAGVRRMLVRLRVDHALSADQIEAVCRHLLATDAALRAHDAVRCDLFLGAPDSAARPDAGQAVWAPMGDWARAAEGESKGDYTLTVTPGPR